MHSRYAPDQRPVWCYGLCYGTENNSWFAALNIKCTRENCDELHILPNLFSWAKNRTHFTFKLCITFLFWNLETYPQRDSTRKIYWPVKSRMEARSADRRAAVIDIGPTARINQLNFSASRWHYSVATLASRASVCDEFLRAICDAWVSAWWSMPTTIYGHDSKMRTSRWCRNVDFWKWEIYWIRIICDKRMALETTWRWQREESLYLFIFHVSALNSFSWKAAKKSSNHVAVLSDFCMVAFLGFLLVSSLFAEISQFII